MKLLTRRRARASHRNWRCPEQKCGRVYASPLPITSISCSNKRRHPTGRALEMVPT